MCGLGIHSLATESSTCAQNVRLAPQNHTETGKQTATTKNKYMQSDKTGQRDGSARESGCCSSLVTYVNPEIHGQGENLLPNAVP